MPRLASPADLDLLRLPLGTPKHLVGARRVVGPRLRRRASAPGPSSGLGLLGTFGRPRVRLRWYSTGLRRLSVGVTIGTVPGPDCTGRTGTAVPPLSAGLN